MATTPENICNQALRQIGYEPPIGSIYEGSRASRVAVEVYGQTRDELLRGGNWPFARQTVTLQLLKTAPPGGYVTNPWSSAYPPPPWIYEYAYPTACLDVRSVRPTPILLPSYSPRVHDFIVGNDPTQSPSKIILTNLGPQALAVITAQIVDPAQWEAAFIEVLIDELAREFQAALRPDVNAEKMREAAAQEAVGVAESRRG